MLLRSASEDIISGGQSQGRRANFTIGAMNAKVFDMLSSAIYNNKIRAVIREYSCNALDGHTAAGKLDVPFHVQLPNEIDPTFKIRDFGTGLTDDEMFEIFSSYFISTKSDTNDMVGGLGLGSKSAFAYVDSFQVRSFQNGKMRSYTCYKQNGIPDIEMILETDTDEEDGLEVSFPVESRDFNRFRSEASFVYAAFDVKPDVSGSFQFVDNLPTISETGVKGILHSTVLGNSVSSRYVAKMGPVFYELKGECYEVVNQNEIMQILWQSNRGILILDVPIGALDIPPSRELIDNTEHSINWLTDFVENITKPCKDQLDAVYQEIKVLTMQEAIAFVETSDKIGYGFRNYFRNNPAYTFKTFFGEECTINRYTDVFDTYLKQTRRKHRDKVEEITKKVRVEKDLPEYVFNPYLRIISYGSDRGVQRRNYFSMNYSNYGMPTVEPFGGVTIYQITDKTSQRVLSNMSKLEQYNGNIFLFDMEREEERFCLDFLKDVYKGDVNVIVLDDSFAPIPKDDKGARAVTARGTKLYEFRKMTSFLKNTHRNTCMCINDVVAFDKPCFWFSADDSKTLTMMHDYLSIFDSYVADDIDLKICEKYGVDEVAIYVLPANLAKHAEKNPNFIHMSEVYESIIGEILSLPLHYGGLEYVRGFSMVYRSEILRKIALFAKIGSKMGSVDADAMAQFMDNVSSTLRTYQPIDNPEKIISLIDYRKQEIAGTIEQQTRRIGEISERFPLLQYLNTHTVKQEHLDQYIENCITIEGLKV